MSNQAVTWAFEQEGLPCKAKFVLVSIANHADHTNGYCWLKVETIAREASIPERSLYRYIGALVRNGYLRREKRRGADGKQRANDYWLLFERPDAAWDWGAHPGTEDEAETQDVVEPGANLAVGESDLAVGEHVEKVHDLAVGPTAIAGTTSFDEPPKTKPEKSTTSRFAAPPRGYKAPPVAPDPQGATHTATDQRLFVYRGTRAWDAWIEHNRRTKGVASSPTYRKYVDGVGWREGWDFPSLFPHDDRPKSESSEEGTGVDPPIKKTA